MTVWGIGSRRQIENQSNFNVMGKQDDERGFVVVEFL
jgi:hypothetical protein